MAFCERARVEPILIAFMCSAVKIDFPLYVLFWLYGVCINKNTYAHCSLFHIFMTGM